MRYNFLQRINENFRSLKNKFFNDRANIKIVSALIVCVFAVILSSIGYSNSISNLQKENYNLSNRYDTLKEDYENSQSMYKTLNLDYKKLNGEYKKLQAELENYKDQQATIDDLNAKLTELHGQYDALLAERDNIQSQLDAKKAEQERIAREQEAQRLAQQQESAIYGTVYWVSGGSVYHSTPNCVTLKRSSNIQSGTIAQSGKSRGCKVCY